MPARKKDDPVDASEEPEILTSGQAYIINRLAEIDDDILKDRPILVEWMTTQIVKMIDLYEISYFDHKD